FAVRNPGQRGCDEVHPRPGYDGPGEHDVNLWLRNNVPPLVESGMELEMDLELFCHLAVDKYERRQRLDRILRSKVVILDKHKGEDALFTMKLPRGLRPTPDVLAKVAETRARTNAPGEVVNGNAALYERALELV